MEIMNIGTSKRRKLQSIGGCSVALLREDDFHLFCLFCAMHVQRDAFIWLPACHYSVANVRLFAYSHKGEIIHLISRSNFILYAIQ